MKIFLLLVFVLLFCRDMSLTAQDYHEKYVILCSNYHLHKKENINFEESFLDVAESFGYKLKRVTSNCDLAETLNYSEFYRNSVVINFNLIDFGNANEVNKLGSYDGNIIVEYYDKLNNSICEYNSKNNQTDMYGRNCSGPGFNAKNKIFVGSIEENAALFNVFRAITDKHIKVENNFRNILLCSDICDSYIINTQFHIICEQCDKEFECDNNTIAIVAPTPEKVKVPFNENIPIIFYDTFYMEEDSGEDTDVSIYDYDTSTTSIHWKALSTMTIDVINSRIWERIAVISDDSVLSKILRNDLIENFVKKSVLFAIRKCSEVDEFKKTLILFKEVRAPIIIVYVAKRNLGKFIRSAQEVEIAKDDVIWVFPGYKENDIKGFKYATFIYCKPEYEVALSIVIHKYKRAFGNEDKFRKSIKNYKPPATCSVDLQRVVYVPLSLTSLKTPYQACALVTNDFYQPCADWHVLYIILTLTIFLVLVFIILVIFNRIQMNTLEYRPLDRPPSVWRRLLQKDRPSTSRAFQMLPRRY